MSDTNIHTGVYEQIINRLFKLKLNEEMCIRDRYIYVEKLFLLLFLYKYISIHTLLKSVMPVSYTHLDVYKRQEVKQLAATPCDIPVLKSASLFACLTGLRISDILKRCV